MRRNNPNRISRPDRVCNCEHQDHFTDRYHQGVVIKVPRLKHRYMSRKSGQAWAMYVGHVCDDCAATCMKDYIIADHVCGTGDCHRECPEMAEFGTCIHSDHMMNKEM